MPRQVVVPGFSSVRPRSTIRAVGRPSSRAFRSSSRSSWSELTRTTTFFCPSASQALSQSGLLARTRLTTHAALQSFGEIIESCHKIEELDNAVQDKNAEKKKLLKSRKKKLAKLRKKLREAIRNREQGSLVIPRSIKQITKLSKETLNDFDDKTSKVYVDFKKAFDEFAEVVTETEELKISYQNSLKELRNVCRGEGLTLLRRTRDAIKVNFFHLGKKEYYAQIKAHGFKLKKK